MKKFKLMIVFSSFILIGSIFFKTWDKLKTSDFRGKEFRNLASENLPWPIEMDAPSTSMANTEAQFQNFDGEWVNYFHSGCDLVAPAGTEVRSPVDGRVFTGFNNHRINPQSRILDSIWAPYDESKTGSPYTFGIWVTDKEGTRFEMVHIDPNSVPTEIFEAARSNQEIKAGTLVGRIIVQPKPVLGNPYHHIHYTIVRADGAIMNCQRLSKTLKDTIPPTIVAVYGAFEDGVKRIENDSLIKGGPVSEFIIDVFDRMNTGILPLQPQDIELQKDNQTIWRWDFSTGLWSGDPSRPLKIEDVFLGRLVLDSGESILSNGNFDSRKFLIRLPVKTPSLGHFKIIVKDMALNETVFEIEIR